MYRFDFTTGKSNSSDSTKVESRANSSTLNLSILLFQRRALQYTCALLAILYVYLNLAEYLPFADRNVDV